MTHNLADKLLFSLGPPIMAALVRLWCRSCPVVVHENKADADRTARAANGAIYVTWHQRMFYFFYDFGPRGITVMISRSRDGDYAAAVARRMGFDTVRGSGSRSYRSALIDLVQRLKRGGAGVGMLADGPLGPPRRLKLGTIALARATGRPIIPLAYGAQRRIVFHSWDRYFLPCPFSAVVVCYGAPVHVAAGAGPEECEKIRQRLETALNGLADRCDTWWGGSPVGKPGFDLPASQPGPVGAKGSASAAYGP
jgi:hypothetical protein